MKRLPPLGLRVSTAFLALALAGSPAAAGPLDPVLFVRTDVNADGRVNIGDVISGVGYLFGSIPAPLCLDAADGNDDGRVDIADPIALLDYLFKGGARPAQPAPDLPRYGLDRCGADPSQDALGCVAFPPCGSPLARFTAVHDPLSPLTVLFDATATRHPDPLRVLTFRWEFGDGQSQVLDLPLVSHAYREARQYLVKLVVTDDRGLSGEQSQLVQVACDEPPPPVLDPPPAAACGPLVLLAGAAEAGSTVEARSAADVFRTVAADGRFSLQVRLASNGDNVFSLTASSSCGTSASTTVAIARDAEPPVIAIQSPLEGLRTSAQTVEVVGTVSDRLSGLQGLRVTVNGAEAAIVPRDARTGVFTAGGIPVNPEGSTVITVLATDRCGQTARWHVTLNGSLGFGSVTLGAMSSPTSFQVYRVTSLADDGSTGTLRDALDEGRRLIVFDVAGTITLQSSLRVRRSYTTIDGFTAPAPGITIVAPRGSGYSTAIDPFEGTPVTDVVIRGLRCDWRSEGVHSGVGDIWAISGDSTGISRLVLDRLTCYGSPDGVFDFFGTASDVSITRCLIGRTNTALNCISGSSSQGRDRITIAHNLFTHNTDRQPRINHRTWDLDMVQNIIHGWGWHEGLDGSTMFVNDGALDPRANVEDNWFLHVPGLDGDPEEAVRIESGCQVYLAGNIMPPECRAVSTGPRLAIPAYAQVPRLTVAQILAQVGAPYRTAADEALIAEVSIR